ncbi:MAG: CPBP family intramembrane glutamic endopeptidase [Parachlamydiales bacterium]
MSAYLIPKTDLKPFHLKGVLLSVSIGIIAGILVLFLNKFWSYPVPHLGTAPPAWAGALASLYGAFNEEVSLRLFLFSAMYLLLQKIKIAKGAALWIANILVAIAFGMGHLPLASQLSPLSREVVTRILVLNGIPGLAFGWLYWSRGIYSAILAHFTADILLHVLPPLFHFL